MADTHAKYLKAILPFKMWKYSTNLLIKLGAAFAVNAKKFSLSIGKQQNSFPSIIHAQNNFFFISKLRFSVFFYQNYNYFYRKLPVVDCIFCCLRMKTPIFLFYVCDWLTGLTVAVVPSECLETLVLPTVSLLSDASQSFFY